jgi:hypothetical protein
VRAECKCFRAVQIGVSKPTRDRAHLDANVLLLAVEVLVHVGVVDPDLSPIFTACGLLAAKLDGNRIPAAVDIIAGGF